MLLERSVIFYNLKYVSVTLKPKTKIFWISQFESPFDFVCLDEVNLVRLHFSLRMLKMVEMHFIILFLLRLIYPAIQLCYCEWLLKIFLAYIAKEVCKNTKLSLGNSDFWNFVCYGNRINSSKRNAYMSFSCYCYKKSS